MLVEAIPSSCQQSTIFILTNSTLFLVQTNVYPTAVRRKMRSFDGFKRRAIVIVPADDEFQRRVAQREAEEGKDVPDSAVLEMKGGFVWCAFGMGLCSVPSTYAFAYE